MSRIDTVCAVLACVLCACLVSGCATLRHRREPAAPGSTATGARPLPGAQESPEQPKIEPDRPSTADETYTVPKALAQFEVGGQYARVPVAGDVMQTPVSVRVGLSNRFEGRLETEGVVREKQASGGTTTDFGGLTVGGKFRVFAGPGGLPVVAVMPSVTLPWGRGTDGGTDVFLRFLGGRDLPRHTSLGVNYALGAIATGHAHFVQHMLAVEGSAQILTRWTPYVELYWFSKVDPEGHRVFSMDTGATYLLNMRMAIDVGVAVGLNAPAGHPEVFGGLSMILGEVKGHRGIYARLREAQLRGDR